MAETYSIKEEPEIQWLKRLRIFILGRNKPPFLTRVYLLAALVSFCYYFFWNLIRFVALNSIDYVENPEQIRAQLQRIGEDFGIADAQQAFIFYAVVMMGVYGFMLVNMVLIYRRKLIGYYLFFVSQLLAIAAPFLTLGFEYATEEVDWMDYAAPVVLLVLFYISFSRLKKAREKARLEQEENRII